MIKFSKSFIHEQFNLTFFRGVNKDPSGNYLFKETKILFAAENLAPNLIEYDVRPTIPISVKNDLEIRKVLDQIQVPSGKKLTILDVRIGDDGSSYEMEIEYGKDYYSDLQCEVVTAAMTSFNRFKINFNRVAVSDRSLLCDIDPSLNSFLKVTVNPQFIHQRGKELSPGLEKHFDPKRYSDTQVAFFLLMTSLPAAANMHK